MYQTKSIIKYNNTDKKVQLTITPNQGLSSSVDNLKRIMIGKMNSDGVREIKSLRFQESNILQYSVNIFQENGLRKYEGREITSEKLHINET